jgi:cytochrome P450
VTRYAEQRALLADPRVSADPYRPGYPFQSEGLRDITEETQSFLNMDDPEHARLRRMVAGTFTVRRIEGLRPAIREIVDDLVSDLLAGPRPADLVSRFALPVPSLAICHLLGVPYADHDFFQLASATLISRETSTAAMKDTMAEASGYLKQLISRKLCRAGRRPAIPPDQRTNSDRADDPPGASQADQCFCCSRGTRPPPI